MKNKIEIDKIFQECIEDMRKPITEFINIIRNPNSIITSLINSGTTNALHMFSSTIAVILEKGPLIEALRETGNEIDEYGWVKRGNLTKPTIH